MQNLKVLTIGITAFFCISIQGCASMQAVKDRMTPTGDKLSNNLNNTKSSNSPTSKKSKQNSTKSNSSSDKSDTVMQATTLAGGAAAIACGVGLGSIEAAALCAMGAGYLGNLLGEEVAKTKEDYANKNDYLDARIKVIDTLINSSAQNSKELAQYTKNITKKIALLEKEAEKTDDGKEKLLEAKNDIVNKLQIAKENHQKIVEYNNSIKKDLDDNELKKLKSYKKTKQKYNTLNAMIPKLSNEILALSKVEAKIKAS